MNLDIMIYCFYYRLLQCFFYVMLCCLILHLTCQATPLTQILFNANMPLSLFSFFIQTLCLFARRNDHCKYTVYRFFFS